MILQIFSILDTDVLFLPNQMFYETQNYLGGVLQPDDITGANGVQLFEII